MNMSSDDSDCEEQKAALADALQCDFVQQAFDGKFTGEAKSKLIELIRFLAVIDFYLLLVLVKELLSIAIRIKREIQIISGMITHSHTTFSSYYSVASIKFSSNLSSY